MVVHGANGEVVLVAAHELGEGASHRQRKSFHVPDFLPETWLRSLMACLLVREQLVRADASVGVEVEVHVPTEHDPVGHPGDLEGWSRGEQLPRRGVGLRVGHRRQRGGVGLARESRSAHPQGAWSHSP